MPAIEQTVEKLVQESYQHGFVTDIDSDTLPPGLSEKTIRHISAKKNEPEWMLENRLKAYRRWLTMFDPEWAHVDYPEIDFQDISYYSAPKKKQGPKSLDEIDPELLDTYNKLGIPLEDVVVQSGDTALTVDLGAYSSRQTLMTGYATKRAAESVTEPSMGPCSSTRR